MGTARSAAESSARALKADAILGQLVLGHERLRLPLMVQSLREMPDSAWQAAARLAWDRQDPATRSKKPWTDASEDTRQLAIRIHERRLAEAAQPTDPFQGFPQH